MSATAMIGGKMYVIGGSNRQQALLLDEALKTGERFDPRTGFWEPVAPMEQQRSRATATVINGYLYVCGGLNGQQTLSSAERFNPATNIWESLPGMSQGRFGAAVAVMSRCLYIVGGADGQRALSSAERFDPEKGAWEELPQMHEERIWARAASVISTITM